MPDHVHMQMQQILREQSGRNAKSYPFAVVANNLTIMIIETLKLRDRRYAATPAVSACLSKRSTFVCR